jgi:HSP20 family protein
MFSFFTLSYYEITVNQKITRVIKDMEIIRYSPFREIDTLQRQFNRLFDDTLFPSYVGKNNSHAPTPAAEITETPEAVYLKLEIPGVEAKDFDIQVTKDTVSISGERQQEITTETNGKTSTEFYYGKFQRVISLPTAVQNNSVTAEYKDGILKLVLPKQEEVKNLAVKVNLV